MSRRNVRLSFMLGVLAPLTVFAQSSTTSVTQPSAASDSNGAKVERIEVTGSHIKRIDVEGVAPVETITRKDIEKTGYDSVSDVIREAGASSFGAARETAGSNAAGNAEVSLRGLGSDNTLVLLNGKRLPTDAVTGAVDLNLIPISAVERVEILKDGASAIYGSDALAGVVNIITRKDFSGTEASITQSIADRSGGKQTNIGLVNGFNTEKLNVVTAMNWRYNQAVQSRDRDWAKINYSQNGNPGSYSFENSTVYTADPRCPAGRLITDPADGSTYCQFNTGEFSTAIPSTNQIGLLSDATYQATNDLKLNVRVGGTHRVVDWSYAPAAGSFTIPNAAAATLPEYAALLASQTANGATAADDLGILYRTTALGNRDSHIVSNSYNALVGATLQLPADWQLDLTVTDSGIKSTDTGTGGYALTSQLRALIAAGAYDPFSANPGSLASVAYVPLETTYARLASAEVQASGELFDYGAGPVSLAVGALYFFQSYDDIADNETTSGNVFGGAGSSGAGHRNVVAAYNEFSVPVITKDIELQLADRYDHYSDFGDTFNPKVGLSWHASDSVLIRGSWGTGFRAPLMQELYKGNSAGYQTFIDHVACNKFGGSYCQAKQYFTRSGGNSNLKAETSTAWNFGAIYEPSRDFNVSLDGYLTNVNDMPGIDYDDLTLAESKGVNPQQYGVTVNRNAAGTINQSTGVIAPLQNLSATKIAGIDLGASYRVAPKWRLFTAQSQMLYYKTEGFPGAGLRDKLGWNGQPGWRNSTGVTYSMSDINDFTLSANTIADQETSDRAGHIGRFTTFDFYYQYKNKEIGTFTVTVKNLVGSAPPEDSSNPTMPVNYSLYDPNGRQLIVGYKRML